MKDKDIVWGSIPIIGLETDEDLAKYSIKQLALLENAKIGAEKMKNLSEQKRKEYSERRKKKNIDSKLSQETKDKIATKAKGRKSAMKGKTFSDEAKIKMSESAKLKVLTEEHKNNIGKSVSGEKNGFYGKTHSDESLKKIMDKHPSKIKKVCPHCKKEFDCANYSRYHGDKCKLK